MRQIVLSANAKDWKFFSELLYKRQPHFCKIIDEVGEDPRCYDAYRFCTQFCAIALEQAEIMTPEQLPIYSRYISKFSKFDSKGSRKANRQKSGQFSKSDTPICSFR